MSCFTFGTEFYPFVLEFISFDDYSYDLYFKAITLREAKEKIAAIRTDPQGCKCYKFPEDFSYQFITNVELEKNGLISIGNNFDNICFGLGGVLTKNGGWNDKTSCFELLQKLTYHERPANATIIFEDSILGENL